MTAQTTFIYFRTSSDSKLSGFGSESEMTSPSNDPNLSILSSNTSTGKAPSTDLPRKSNERTITGVFAYRNATDVETGLPEHRLEQIRPGKTSGGNKTGNASTSAGAVTGTSSNGASMLGTGNQKPGLTSMNGIVKPGMGSRTASLRSIGSSVERGHGQSGTVTPMPRALGSADGLNMMSNGDATTDPAGNASTRQGDSLEQRRLKPLLLRGMSEGSMRLKAETASSQSLSAFPPLQPDPAEVSPTLRQQGSSAHRFSSPPRMSQIPSYPLDATPRHSLSPEATRLTQRHTLQVPRSAGGREFSFAAGDEVITATGRFSPTRENEPPTPRHRRPSLGLVRRTTRSMVSDALPDEVPPDEEAARWTELIKQKRASRRKKKEEEDDERVIVGKKVDEGHVNWVTAYNMLTGIRFTVSRTNAKIDRELTDGDFDARHKFSFDITGNELTPSAKYDFKFKDYSPWVFRHLRAIFGLDPADYLMSLTSKYILSELGSPGKSGSFFYFSRDYKYIIKTIHHAEHKLLRKILREYYNHVRDNPNTLISQFYGLHRVKIPYGRKIHFVVMNNLFPPHRDIHQTFDLKGSTVGRDFKEEDLENNPRATLKDLNWLRRDLHLEFQQQVKRLFLDQIQRDVALLQRLHIMDYSLLVGMHDLEKGNEEKVRETTLQVFQPGGERDDEDDVRGVSLLRTPSRLESARKARELRLTLKKEKPMPMSLVTAKMPNQMTSTDERQYRIFYSDDGGIRATHEDGTGSDMVYYLGIIDCLTHYGFVKRVEHFWKGLSNSRTQISPIPPQNYGERFVNFITGITMTKEEAERRRTTEGSEMRESVDAHNILHHHHLPSTSRISADVGSSRMRSSSDDNAPPRSPVAVERTMRKAQKQVEKTSLDKNRPSEDELPDRHLGTMTVPSSSEKDQDDTLGRNSTTLPVVQEVGEGSSDVGSRKSVPGEAEATGSKGAGHLMPGSSSIDRESPSNRQVSVNTVDRHGFHEYEKAEKEVDDQLEPRLQQQLNEKFPLATPVSEYHTPMSPNFSRPIVPNTNGQSPTTPTTATSTITTGQNGILPRLTPIYSSPEVMDPEKSVVMVPGRNISNLGLSDGGGGGGGGAAAPASAATTHDRKEYQSSHYLVTDGGDGGERK